MVGGNNASLKHPDREEGSTGEAGGEANNRRERESWEDSDEDIDMTMTKKRSAEVDPDILLATAKEVTSNKKRVVEVKVRASSPLFADADSDILLEAWRSRSA